MPRFAEQLSALGCDGGSPMRLSRKRQSFEQIGRVHLPAAIDGLLRASVLTMTAHRTHLHTARFGSRTYVGVQGVTFDRNGNGSVDSDWLGWHNGTAVCEKDCFWFSSGEEKNQNYPVPGTTWREVDNWIESERP